MIGKTIKEAESILKEAGLGARINNAEGEINKEEEVVTEQLPISGVTVYEGSEVYLEY